MGTTVEIWTMKGLSPEGSPLTASFDFLPRAGESVVTADGREGVVEKVEHRAGGSTRLYLQESVGMEAVGGNYPG